MEVPRHLLQRYTRDAALFLANPGGVEPQLIDQAFPLHDVTLFRVGHRYTLVTYDDTGYGIDFRVDDFALTFPHVPFVKDLKRKSLAFETVLVRMERFDDVTYPPLLFQRHIWPWRRDAMTHLASHFSDIQQNLKYLCARMPRHLVDDLIMPWLEYELTFQDIYLRACAQ